MELLEIKRKQHLSREEAARRLHALADHLARHNDVEFDNGGMQFKLHVPDELDLKIELEVESDGTELEIELTW
jgi:amphi-Trp domain-containing protein